MDNVEDVTKNRSVFNKESINVRFVNSDTDSQAVCAEQLVNEITAEHKLVQDFIENVAKEAVDVIADSSLVEKAPEPVLAPKPEMTIVNSAQNLTTSREIKSWNIEAPKQDNQTGMIVLDTLKKYEEVMRPKRPLDKRIAGQQQTNLYQSILRVCREPQNFNKNWELILSRVYENPNNVYGINYVFRSLDQMSGSKLDVQLFTRLMNLIILTCDPDPEVRKLNLKRVSIEKTLAGVSSDVIRNNILGYYRQYVA